MKTYTVEELKAICEKHIKWLRDEEGGKTGLWAFTTPVLETLK